MSERLTWWSVGTVVVGGIFCLCLFGFTFLNQRVDASERAFRAEIKDVRYETSDSIKDLRLEMRDSFKDLGAKIEAIRK